MVWFCRFCFFKQKTAYELRISDWSSDVCSSDLVRHVAQQRHRLFKGPALVAMLQGVDPPGSQDIGNGGDLILVIMGPARPDRRLSRSEERRVGQECVGRCRFRRSPYK